MSCKVEHQMLERRVLQELSFWEWRLATGSILTSFETSVQVQNHVAKHVPQEDQSEEVVAEELQVWGILEKIYTNYIILKHRKYSEQK